MSPNILAQRLGETWNYQNAHVGVGGGVVVAAVVVVVVVVVVDIGSR